MPRLRPLLVAALTFTAVPLVADTLIFPEYNCRIVVPSGGEWKDEPIDTARWGKGLVMRSTGKRMVSLDLYTASSSLSLEEGTGRDLMQRQIASLVSQVIERTPTRLGGVPALEVIGTSPAIGTMQTTDLIVAAADSRLYLLVLSSIEGDPRDDRELRSVVESFAFLKPPHVADAERTEDEEEASDSGFPVWPSLLGILVLVVGLWQMNVWSNGKEEERRRKQEEFDNAKF